MPAARYFIASVTVGSGGASTIDFSSIPQTYTHLAIKYSVRFNNASPYANTVLRLNGSTTSYTMTRLYGDGASASAYTNTDIFDVANGDTSTANSFNNGEFYIPNYAGSNYKSTSGDAVMETNATTAQQLLTAGLWSSTAAITSLSLSWSGGNFKQYSTATLYGIKNS